MKEKEIERHHEPLLRVMALHALEYCERLFYLEEVEEIRLADASVYAGRTLHEELALEEGKELRSFSLSSETLGVTGKVDALRHHEGSWIPYEHKRGRPFRDPAGTAQAWTSDILQVGAYCMLLEEYLGKPVPEGRIRYHAEGITVRVPFDELVRNAVRKAIKRAMALRQQTTRPPVTEHEGKCSSCSLAPVCLPEEERLAKDGDWKPTRLFPQNIEGTTLHITGHKTKISKSGQTLKISGEENETNVVPINDIHAIVVHGNAQISTQTLHFCAANNVHVHWFSSGGVYVAGLSFGAGGIHRRLRQFSALSNPGICLSLARKTASAKIEGQLRYLLRASRQRKNSREDIREPIEILKESARATAYAEGTEILRGIEGNAARAYFGSLRFLLHSADVIFQPSGRNRRPPRDRFNALLSFGYSLLYRSVLEAILTVGLEPALGFFHTPRSTAHPLVLDLMELFRVSVWDIPLIGSLNRRQWDPEADFSVTKEKVWLSREGRKKAIRLYEKRLQECWKHPIMDYSLSYRRMIELEVRLLEKEWSGQPGLFAKTRLR